MKDKKTKNNSIVIPKEGYFLFGLIDTRFKEVACLGYERLKVSTSKVKTEIGDFHSIKTHFEFEFSVGNWDTHKDVEVGGYLLFGKKKVFGDLSFSPIVFLREQTNNILTAAFDITWHDLDSIYEFIRDY